MIKTTPEHGGIHSSSKNGLRELKLLIYYHNIKIKRRNEILLKITASFSCRLSSYVFGSKSFGGNSGGFAMQDGLFGLDDPIGKYFPVSLKVIPIRIWVLRQSSDAR